MFFSSSSSSSSSSSRTSLASKELGNSLGGGIKTAVFGAFLSGRFGLIACKGESVTNFIAVEERAAWPLDELICSRNCAPAFRLMMKH
jgi:hypothetical protein